MLKGINIPYTKDDKQISLYDFFVIYLSLCSLYMIIDNFDFDAKKVVKAELEVFSLYKDIYRTALTSLSNLLNSLVFEYSDFQKQIYYFEYKSIMKTNKGIHFQSMLIINSSKPEIAYIKINKEYRPAVHLGYSNDLFGITWIRIKPSALNLKNTFADLPHDVYIQSHAFIRLKERLHCLSEPTIMVLLFYSLTIKPKLFYDKNNKMMLEFISENARFGYLPIEITDGKIVIKTFLFVTSSNTPEGQILEKYTGLLKDDKKYLEIDKSSTFMNTDIIDNKDMQNFLKKSGCQNLINLYKNYKEGFEIISNSNNLNKMIELMEKNKEYKKENELLMNTEV